MTSSQFQNVYFGVGIGVCTELGCSAEIICFTDEMMMNDCEGSSHEGYISLQHHFLMRHFLHFPNVSKRLGRKNLITSFFSRPESLSIRPKASPSQVFANILLSSLLDNWKRSLVHFNAWQTHCSLHHCLKCTKTRCYVKQ